MKKIIPSAILVVIIAFFAVVLVKEINKKDDSKVVNNEDNVNEIINNENTSDEQNLDDKITIVFGGDVLLSDSMVNTYNKNGGNIENIMSKRLLDEFTSADIAMVNQEFPFSLRGTKMQDKQYTFKTDPVYVKVLNEMGLDIVSLANNHTIDFGIDALTDTFETLKEASIQYGGAGNNIDEAKEVKYIDKAGKKVAFLCASRVIPVTTWNATADRPGLLTTYDPTLLLEQIKIAKENADYAVVYVHWGVEHQDKPKDYQKNMAKQYIDAGADVVIGCHTHCLQGVEIYNGKTIIYSMGNFLFGGTIERTMMVKIGLDSEITTQILPCVAKSYCTSLVEDENKKKEFYEYYRGISFDVDIDEEGYVKVK